MNVAVCDNTVANRAKELRRRLSDDAVVRINAPLGPRTTLGVGGPADLLVRPRHEPDLSAALRFCEDCGIPWRVIGRGSNLLVRDGGFRGMVVVLDAEAFTGVEATGQRLACGSGARLKAVAGIARREGIAGLEFLEGIPGSIGGALRMNAGAHGRAICDIAWNVRYAEPGGDVREIKGAELGADYRSCEFLENRIVIGATLAGQRDEPAAIRARMGACAERRRATQPREPSAGCIFKNPSSVAAGQLIEELGLKGAYVGGAKVSEVHGNFIVNSGSATAGDVLELIDRIRTQASRAGVNLCTEVEILGEDIET